MKQSKRDKARAKRELNWQLQRDLDMVRQDNRSLTRQLTDLREEVAMLRKKVRQ